MLDWIPGQGVKIDYAAIVEILLQQLDEQREYPATLTPLDAERHLDDVIQQSTALRWLTEFLNIVQDVMVAFTPRLISVILPNLSHPVPMIQSAALRTNKALLDVVQSLPPPVDVSTRQSTDKSSSAASQIAPGSPTPALASLAPSRQPTAVKDNTAIRDLGTPETFPTPEAAATNERPPTSSSQRTRTNALQSGTTIAADTAVPAAQASRPASPVSAISMLQVQTSPEASLLQEKPEQLDYQATVNALTIQFLSEHEDTRVAALKWLIMLHQKAPRKVREAIECIARY